MKNRKNPNLNINLIPILYIVGLAGVVWFIASYFYPNFWARYYGSDLFWPSIVAMGICLFFSSHSYTEAKIAFVIIIGLILYQFGDYPFLRGKPKKPETVWVWHVKIPKVDSVLIYEGKPTGRKIFLPNDGWTRISPECGLSVSCKSKNWSTSENLVGCSGGEASLPPFNEWVKISIIE